MKNKICEECKHFDKTVTCNDYAKCSCKEQLVYGFVSPKQQNCKHFEPKKKLTNGDKIRAMSDEELAKLFVYFKRRTTDEDVYGSILFKQIPFEGKQRAIEETLEELKKEVENDCKI